jgi:PAS domain S-box-containing protein
MTSTFSKHKYFLPTVLIFALSVFSVFTTYIFQNIEDELDDEILMVEHQRLLLNVIKQYHPAAVRGDDEALKKLEETSRSFRNSVEALRIGGRPDGMEEKIIVHGTDIPEAKQQISAIIGLWEEYRTENRQARQNFKHGETKGAEENLIEIRNKFFNLKTYNDGLLQSFIEHKSIVHIYKVSSIGGMLLITFVVLIIAYFRFIRKVNKPLEELLEVADALEQGDLSKKVKFVENTPIGSIAKSINRIVANQNDLTDKFNQLGEGTFSFDITNHGKDDKLNAALESMRKKLYDFYELDRKKASQGNWVNKGVALFSEILRNNTDDISKLTDILISDMVKYLKANQGCIYLLEESSKTKDKKLILKSTYAWERKKFQEKELEVGEGLIGQAFLEQGTIYLTDVPDSYVNITSGLGEANPRSILIVPMLYNDEIYGVLEIASFNEYEEFELQLVEKIAQSIASAISTVRNNEHTRILLQESQMLTEQMRSQEEELRQNAEELQATQENINRQLEMIDFEKQKNTAVLETSADAILTFDENGFVEFFNESAEEIFLTKREKVLGKKIANIIPFEIKKDGDKYSVKFKEGDRLIDIGIRSEVNIYDSEGEEVNVLMTLSVNNIQNKYFFAVFIQSIAVELF